MALRVWLFGMVGMVAACGSGGGFPDARVMDAPIPGTFSVEWAVTDETDRPILCDAIGANSVTVLAHNRAFQGGSTQVFSCRTGSGVSELLAPGTYDFEFELVGAGGVIARLPAQGGIEMAPGANVRLAPLTFKVVASGALSLALLTGRVRNCDAPPGGGGITSTEISLVRSPGETCQPLVLNISAGATSGAPASTYQIDCAAPFPECIENDQTISASPVPSGSYTIHVVGKQGATVCWSNHDNLQVPPSGQTLSRSLNLAFTTAGCM